MKRCSKCRNQYEDRYFINHHTGEPTKTCLYCRSTQAPNLAYRVCHDCGKPSENQYRCAKCKRKWQEKNFVTSSDDYGMVVSCGTHVRLW